MSKHKNGLGQNNNTNGKYTKVHITNKVNHIQVIKLCFIHNYIIRFSNTTMRQRIIILK